MNVTYHRCQIVGPFAYHDWLEVAGMHYETGRDGRTKSQRPSQSGGSLGGCTWPCSLGTTYKSHAEIEAFNREWRGQHRQYNLGTADCQLYARDLAAFLGVRTGKIPLRDGAVALVVAAGAQGAATIKNDTKKTITVNTYDEADGVCWVAFKTYTIAPGKQKDCIATGGMGRASCKNIQVSVNGSSCYMLRTVATHAWTGDGFK
mmetsp:Transcript_131496/g.327948  ORF Transcript_131496/g.327948 Transcript_131496/m.327948 type:complete len:204 (+) Transcript_131496:119-730(+)